MSNLPAILATFFLALAFLTGCSSPASSNPVSEDGFVTIHGGMYTVDCDEQGSGCREVTFDTFEVSQYEVTFDEWDDCSNSEYCKFMPYDEGWGRGQRPVININIEDIYVDFLPWVNRDQNYSYSIPTLDQYLVLLSSVKVPKCLDAMSVVSYDCTKLDSTREVGILESNQYGLYDLYGNVGEWTLTRSERDPHRKATLYWTIGLSWDTLASRQRLDEVAPNVRDNRLGFRLVRSNKDTVLKNGE